MNHILKEQNIEGNRKYKDSLFRMVFEKKEDLLNLYNAMNGTDYKNAEELEVNTLDNALYMGIKNDISFLIGYTMNLWKSAGAWKSMQFLSPQSVNIRRISV